MASSEIPLPWPATSALLDARQIIVDEVEQWSTNFRKSATIGHAGRVTQSFLVTQSGQPPRSIITVVAGNNERLGGGKAVLSLITWQWWIVVAGTLRDRTSTGLAITGEAKRLVTRSPWFDAYPDGPFAKTPVAETVQFLNTYTDKDEKSGLTAWAIQWQQAIDLGSAGRTPDPVGEVLESIVGTLEIDGDPNQTDVPVLVT